MLNTDLSNNSFDHCQMLNNYMLDTNMCNIVFKKIIFKDNKMVNSYFNDSDLSNGSFEGCDLTNSEFLHTRMDHCDLSGSIINNIKISNDALYNVIVSSDQALILAGLLHIIIK